MHKVIVVVVHMYRLSPAELHAIKQINSDETIIILPADKGRATVILDKTAYTEKVIVILFFTDKW